MIDPFSIRRAVPDDASALAELAARTYYETFAADCKPDDMIAFLAATYGPDIQLAEIIDPLQQTIVAESVGLIGYVQLRHGAKTPACVTTPKPLEVRRVYVDRLWHGRGVAQRLMQEVFQVANSLGAGSLWLGVFERNYRAVAFYKRHGFVDVGSHEFVVGTDVQTDRVMVLTLSPS